MGDVDVLMNELKDIKATVDNKVAAGIKPLAEENARMAKALEQAQAETKKLKQEQAMRVGSDNRLQVASGRYAGFSAADLALAETALDVHYMNQRALGNSVNKTEQKAWQELKSARHDLRVAFTPDHAIGWYERAMKMAGAAHSTYRPTLTRFAEGAFSWSNEMRKFTKALDSTTAAAGDELVPTLEAAELWMNVNLATTILPVMRQVPMPSNPFDWPTQLGDVNWYPSTENVQVTTTTPSTGKVTLTAYGLKAGIPFSDELTEDAVIALVPELNRSLARNAAEVIDDVLLNADTTTTNGINSDGATINTASAGKAQWLLGFNGLRHLPLVVNTQARADRNGAVTAADVYNRAMRLMGKYAAAQVMGDVVFMADVNTVIASLTIAEVETVDTFGPRATISTGELARIYGVPIIVSGQFKLADTDGSVTDAGNATNTGSVMGVNTSQWYVGFRRGITFESDREPGKGQTTLYTSFRIALQGRSTTSATASNHTSLVYDITGVV